LFDRFKFEISSNSPSNWEQIKLIKATDFKFINYRYENNKALENTMPFCIMDLTEQDATKLYVTHSSKNVFIPVFISKVGHTITFVNTLKLQTCRSEVAKIEGIKRYQLLGINELALKYRRLNANYHIIKNVFRKPYVSTNLTDEILFDYSASDLLLPNGVSVTSSFSLVIYVTNLSVGDELTLEKISSDGTFVSTLFKVFDIGDAIIPNGIVIDTKVIGIEGVWNDTSKGFVPYSSTQENQTITINHENIKTLAIQFYGNLKGFNLYSNNNKNVIRASKNDIYNTSDKFFHTSIPTMGDAGYWNYGDIVYNTNTNVGQVIGWEYNGNSTWGTLAVRT